MARRHSIPQYVLIAAIMCILLAFALGVYAVGQLQSMAANLQRVESRLSALQAVDRKLDGLQEISAALGTMRRQLRETNTSLVKTNGLLVTTNSKLAATNSKLNATEGDVRSLSSIRGDIHEMSRKISGSFLFRGVR